MSCAKRNSNQKLIIIFDLDGTILDISQRYYEVYKSILKKRNFQTLSKEEYWNLKKNKMSDNVIIAKTCPRSFIFRYKRERDKIVENRRFLIFDKVMLGTKSTLRRLIKRESRLYLLTMRKNRKNLFWQLNKLHLTKYFNKIFSPQKKSTPHLEVKRNFIKEVKKSLLTSPDLPIIIGDTEADIIAGKKEGIITCGVLSGIRSKAFLSNLNPDYIFNNISELLNFCRTYENSFRRSK